MHSFPFEGTRLDVALRAFLEAFRLPGEAPLISMVIEHFAGYWQELPRCGAFHSIPMLSLSFAVFFPSSFSLYRFSISLFSLSMFLCVILVLLCDTLSFIPI